MLDIYCYSLFRIFSHYYTYKDYKYYLSKRKNRFANVLEHEHERESTLIVLTFQHSITTTEIRGN